MDDLLPFFFFFWLNIFIKHNLNIKNKSTSSRFFFTAAPVIYNFKSVQRVINSRSTTCRHLTLLYTTNAANVYTASMLYEAICQFYTEDTAL